MNNIDIILKNKLEDIYNKNSFFIQKNIYIKFLCNL